MLYLKPIRFDEKEFNHRKYECMEMDVVNTKIILYDYDWMNYTLKAELPVKPYGNINVEFKFDGFGKATMRVRTPGKHFMYRFNSNLFKKHLIKILTEHIDGWNKDQGFLVQMQ